nr:BTB/POZ and MATH domain-containing protein 1-like [Setaria viridis]
MPRRIPTSRMVSTCTAETEHGDHVFEIFDYSQHRGMGTGKYIRSCIFSVGGYGWAIRFFPDGFSKASEGLLLRMVCSWAGASLRHLRTSKMITSQSNALSVVTVRKDPHVSVTELFDRIEISPSNITEKLGKLLDSEEITDVTLLVLEE